MPGQQHETAKDESGLSEDSASTAEKGNARVDMQPPDATCLPRGHYYFTPNDTYTKK